MDFDRIRLQTFLDEATSVSTLIDGSCSEDSTEFRVDRVNPIYHSWIKNLVITKQRLPSSIEVEKKSQIQNEVLSLDVRIKNSKLASLRTYTDIACKRKRGLSTFISADSEVAKDFQATEGKCADLILEVGVYSSGKTAGPKLEFDILASSLIQGIMDKLRCQPPELAVLRSLESVQFECPKTLEQLHSLLEAPKCIRDLSRNSSMLIIINNQLYGLNANNLSENGNYDDLAGKRWIDMDFRLCETYSMVHESGCKHHLVIHQIRLSRPEELGMFAKSNIIERSKPRERRKICRFCDQYNSLLMTKDDRLAPENPCHFCLKCFESFHYDSAGNLIYSDFTVYPSIGEF